MTLFTITNAYLKTKWSNTLLYCILMALGVSMITALLLFAHQMQERLYRDSAGIDVVIGAKGSPLQLILSSIQHIDIPTGNIAFSEAKRIQKDPNIKQAIPISLGDTYERFRIVGSEASYLKHFKAEFLEGKIWKGTMQAVVGAVVAQETGMSVGNSFIGAHGVVPGGIGHDEHPYHVVGVLKPTGTVLDRLIVTSLESVWDVHKEPGNHEEGHADEIKAGHDNEHEHHDEHEEEHIHEHKKDHAKTEKNTKEITALLVTYSNRAAAFSFPRMINKQTSMQAASPAFEMARLVELIGVGSDTVFVFSTFLVTVALISVMIGLLNSIRERRYDLAVFRTLGASRGKVMMLVIMEGMSIALIGSVLGLLFGHGFIEMIGIYTVKGSEMGLSGFMFLPEVWIIWGIVVLFSVVICLVPAWEAYKTDIRSILTHG